MSFFTVLVIGFILIQIVRAVIKYMNEQNQQTQNTGWENSYSARLRSVLGRYNNFHDEEIIDSAVGFYLFSYNEDTKEFIFIQEDATFVINHFTYQQLTYYNIRNTRDYGIFIDIKTNLPGKQLISIECFNREKALSKIPNLSSNPERIDNLYRLEQEKVEEIGYILEDILEEQKNTEIPPEYKDKIEVIPKETIAPKATPTPLPKTEIDTIDIIQDNIPVETKENTYAFEDIPSKEVSFDSMYEQTVSNEIPEINKQPVDPHVEEKAMSRDEIGDKIEVFLSDIEDYSRGKFLDWEIQSSVGDAKMKGQKSIYLTSEQLEKLKS